MKRRIYTILTIDGKVYCSAETYDMADKIIEEDIDNGNLLLGATIQETNLFS